LKPLRQMMKVPTKVDAWCTAQLHAHAGNIQQFEYISALVGMSNVY
jgi:hypothetical protein